MNHPLSIGITACGLYTPLICISADIRQTLAIFSRRFILNRIYMVRNPDPETCAEIDNAQFRDQITVTDSKD